MPFSRGQKLCNGTRRDGQPCTQPAVKGRTKCRQHGGQSLSGIASPSYRHGKYSADLPTKYAADYHAAISDPEIHALTHEIGVIEARYRDLLRRAESSDLGHAWTALSEAWDAFEQAGDEVAQLFARDAVKKAIARGKQDYLLWQNIQETTKLLSTLRVQEHRRLVDLELVMTQPQWEQALGLIQLALRESVMGHVEAALGREILADTQRRVARYLPKPVVEAEVVPSKSGDSG